MTKYSYHLLATPNDSNRMRSDLLPMYLHVGPVDLDRGHKWGYRPLGTISYTREDIALWIPYMNETNQYYTYQERRLLCI